MNIITVSAITFPRRLQQKAIVAAEDSFSTSEGRKKRQIVKTATRLIHLQNGYNDTKQANCTAKDFHNENLHEEAGVLGVCQCCSAAHNADADAAEEVGKAHSQTGSEHGVT